MKATQQRLTGALINIDKPMTFYFDGKAYQGYEGDTLASALLANGVNIVGRSFKLHRPRGIFGAGKEEVNAFVQLEEGAWTEPNTRATLQALYPGLKASSQNAWPNARWDIGAVMQLFKPVLPASFYYKTFMWPHWSWWEALVRRLAGLGKPPRAKDPQHYHKRNLHTELLIIGGGPAGLAAALLASCSKNTRVVLLDDQEVWGGSLLSGPLLADSLHARRTSINGISASAWLAETLCELERRPNVTLLGRTTAIGYYDHNVIAAVERISVHLGPAADTARPRERLWRLRAKQVILATGAIERPLVFPDNDRPGIMLASAVEQYVHRYGLRLADHLVFYTNNDSVYTKAIELLDKGVGVAAVIDVRHQVAASLLETLQQKGIQHYAGYAVTATKGSCGLKRLRLTRLNQQADGLTGECLTLDCDLLAMSGGWTPTVHLFSQSGGKLDFNDTLSCFVPLQAVQPCVVAGSANGEFSTKAALDSGSAAAFDVLNKLGRVSDTINITDTTDITIPDWEADTAELTVQSFWATPGVSTHHQWVDFQYDVTASDIGLAVRENFTSIEHVKRYTTAGMCIDQGKTSNVNTLAILGMETERQIAQVGTTRFRPPYHPTTMGALAGRDSGRHYRPFQLLPAHACHVKLGGKFADFGGWQRPEYYPRGNETEAQTLAREVNAVRGAVGILDYSPLGKLEVRGPDAREFLNRLYVNNIKTLKVGAARYGLMLNDKGIVVDDGVMVCLAEDHFLLHTTSGGATTMVLALEEWLQCEWLDLQVLVTNSTTQWATLTLSGPRARALLQTLDSDIHFDREAFPHMQFRQGTLLGVPTRILRASFTGEVSYEISVPARYGESLWNTLMEAGSDYGITPFGVESLMVMRTEKGFLHVGQDTDGTTMPQDIGWAGAIAKQTADFVGKRSLTTEHALAEGRLQFVGIEPVYPQTELLSGAHVLSPDGNTSHGYVTSACFSPGLGKTVALGIVANGRQRLGEEVTILLNGYQHEATLVSPGAYDPQGEAVNG